MENPHKALRLVYFLIFSISTLVLQAQRSSENGFSVPFQTGNKPLRVYMVFAEVADPQNCASITVNGCGSSQKWPAGQIPTDVDEYLDPTTTPDNGKATQFLREASFGQMEVLGDYYPDLVSITCNDIANVPSTYTSKFDQLTFAVMNRVGVMSGNTYTTAHGLVLDDFCNYDIPNGQYGVVKLASNSDDYIDYVAIIFRNVNVSRNSCVNAQIENSRHEMPFGNKLGFDNIALHNNPKSDGWWSPFMVELTHAMYGGNHFHAQAALAASSTFVQSIAWYSILGQDQGGIMRMFNAWDRHRSGWKKSTAISLIQANNQPSDIFTGHGDGIYYLRDFATEGDAIRIKLPYLNDVPNEDVYNQYLWIENHRMNTTFDESIWTSNSCNDGLSSGMYAYITVGKDIKTGSQAEVFTSAPMNLSGWFWPLTAEGNFDFYYDYNHVQQQGTTSCDLGTTVPIDKSKSLSNPFTGHNDFAMYVDTDKDGVYEAGNEPIGWGFGEVVSGNVVNRWPFYGDPEDAFTVVNGNTKIGMATNPSSAPVYTHSFGSGLPPLSSRTYENRKIWLNGISVEILDEDALNDGTGVLKVEVRTDNYEVDRDVRWCGDIVLSDFGPTGHSSGAADYLDVQANVTLDIDQGLSPTRTQDPITFNGELLLAAPTVFTCKPGAHFHMDPLATVRVKNGSTMIMESGSKLEVHENAFLFIEAGSTLIIEDGAELAMHHDANVFINEGATLILKDQTITGRTGLNIGGSTSGSSNTATLYIRGTLEVTDGAVLNNKGDGHIWVGTNGDIMFGNGAGIDWDMKGQTGLRLLGGADVLTRPAYVRWRNGSVAFRDNVRLRLISDDVDIDNIVFGPSQFGTGNTNGLELYCNDIVISNSHFDDFSGIGLNLVEFTPGLPTSTATLTNCSISGNGLGLDAQFIKLLTLVNSSVTNNTVGVNVEGLSALGLSSFYLDNSQVSNNTNVGIEAVDIYELSLENASIIDHSAQGISAQKTNVFIRDQSVVRDCLFGLSLVGDQANQSHKLLTIGDRGCGYVINNDFGISATDMVLDIDAISHNAICPGCGTYANRFDGNAVKIADVCYTFNPPSQILARGAYFGTALPNSNSGIDAVLACQGSGSNIKIPVLATELCNKLPVGCFCTPNRNPHDPHPQNPGPHGIGGVEQALFATQCVSPDDGEVISEKYRRGYIDFLNKDKAAAMPEFETMAQINYRTSPGFIYKCEHLIRIAEILAGTKDGSGGFGTGSGNPFEISLSPNPASDQVVVAIPQGDGSTANIRITDVYGIERKNINTGSLMEIINISDLSLGVYNVNVIKGNDFDMKHLEVIP